MGVSYKKLWKLLIDKDMKKKDLQLATGLSSSTIAKMTKNESVNTEVLVKVCTALGCDIGDIIMSHLKWSKIGIPATFPRRLI